MNNRNSYIERTMMAGLLACLLASCGQQQPAGKSMPVREKHLAEKNGPGVRLVVDKVDNKLLMAAGERDRFVSYRIGFYDSVKPADKKELRERGVYYQYKMQRDWKAIVQGDSIAPVFYQPVAGLNDQVNEGVLVFELAEGQQPDTLVYEDATGLWQKQIIVLKAK